MKTFSRLFAGLLLLLAAACARHKIIPDRELAEIFHDAFLTNAYVGDRHVNVDSLRIYEPIFAKYGYTTEDVYYTIGNFSKRKSARLGDVVEQAIDMLEAEGAYYDREVAILDTIDQVARRTFTRRVFADSSIYVGSLRDTARLRISLDTQTGEYDIRFKYHVDSLDRNEKGIRAMVWLERLDSTRVPPYTTTLRRGREDSYTRRITTDSTHRSLHLNLLDFRDKPLRPSVRVTDLVIEYTPPTAVAVDSLYLRQLNMRVFADEFLRAARSEDSR